jgi:hypothetical protein
MKKKKRTTIEIPIADLARHELEIDRLCPDVGMGMGFGSAIDNVLAHYGLKRSDVDFDAILNELYGKN